MQVLALVMLAPRSYTAEDVVELHCHGGAMCARRVLACCLAAGARLARPGEFTLRAFLNGRLDLTQAPALTTRAPCDKPWAHAHNEFEWVRLASKSACSRW